MNYPHDIDIILRRNVDILQQWIEQKRGLLLLTYVWKERYKKLESKIDVNKNKIFYIVKVIYKNS